MPIDDFIKARFPVAPVALDVRSVHVWSLPYHPADGRTPLRVLLAAYLHEDAAALAFALGAHGRPQLAKPHDLDFNWSHSGARALVAVARELPQLGVDIERVRPRPNALALAQRFFARSEADWLASRSATTRTQDFLRLWTAKEAVVKAVGRGLAFGLERVVFMPTEAGMQARQFFAEAGPAQAWQVHAMVAPGQWLGTVAWRGPPRDVHGFIAEPGPELAASME